MIRRIRSAIAVLALLAGLFASPAAASASADAGGGDNTAVAVNTVDGSSVIKLAFSVRRVVNGAVDHTNAAIAYASCSECQTVALAIQVVLVAGDPEVVTPANLALAVNDSCTSCATLASAYQFVLGTGEVVRFTKEGNRQLHDLRRRFKDLKHAELSIGQIQAEMEALVAELGVVLDHELERVGRPENPALQADTTTTTGPGADVSSSTSMDTEATTTTADPEETTTSTTTTTTTSSTTNTTPSSTTTTEAEPVTTTTTASG